MNPQQTYDSQTASADKKRWRDRVRVSVPFRGKKKDQQNEPAALGPTGYLSTVPPSQAERDAPYLPIQLPISEEFMKKSPQDLPAKKTPTLNPPTSNGDGYQSPTPGADTNPSGNRDTDFNATHFNSEDSEPSRPPSITPSPLASGASTPRSADSAWGHFSNNNEIFKTPEPPKPDTGPKETGQTSPHQGRVFELSTDGGSSSAAPTSPIELPTESPKTGTMGFFKSAIGLGPPAHQPRYAPYRPPLPQFTPVVDQKGKEAALKGARSASALGGRRDSKDVRESHREAREREAREREAREREAREREAREREAREREAKRSHLSRQTAETNGVSESQNLRVVRKAVGGDTPEAGGQAPPPPPKTPPREDERVGGDVNASNAGGVDEHNTENNRQDSRRSSVEESVDDASVTQGPSEESVKGRRRKLGLSFGSSEKKQEKLHKGSTNSSASTGLSTVDHKRLKQFLKDYGVKKNGYLDPLSLLLQWVPEELGRADARVAQKQYQIEQREKELIYQIELRDKDLKKASDEIIRLNTTLGSTQRSEKRLYDDWVKAEAFLDNAKVNVKTLESNIQAANTRIEGLQARFNDVSEKLGAAVYQRDEVQGQCDKLNQELEDQAANSLKWHENEMLIARTRHETELSTTIREHKRSKNDLIKEKNAEKENIKKQLGDEIRDLHASVLRQTDAHNQTVAELKLEHGQELDSLNTKLTKKITKLQSQVDNHEAVHQNEIAGIREDHRQELLTLNDTMNRRVAELETQNTTQARSHKKALKQIEEEHALELTDLNSAKEIIIDELKDKLYNLSESHKIEVNDIYVRHDEEIVSLKAAWTKEVDDLRSENKQQDYFHKQATAKTAKKHKEEIAGLNAAMTQLQNDHDIKMSTLKANHADELAAIKKSHQEEIDGVVAIMEKLKSEHEANIKKETRNLRKRANSLERHMAGYSSTGGYIAIPDDEFRGKFSDLAIRIKRLIAWVPRPDTYAFDPSLDPNSFMKRYSQQSGGNWPKFIRNVCWRVILRGFYSRQMGFGALGASGSEGFDFLDHLYQLFAMPDPEGERNI